MRVWIGTSGYSYPDWVGAFYPAGTRPPGMLAYYCRHFPLVELNFTFYRPPTAAMLARLAEQTPEGFQFVVKLPRTISHDHDRRDLPGFRQAVEELRRHGRLLGLLCQLPQAQHHDRRNLAWLDSLAGELAGYRLAIEFRHRSWSRPDVPPWLGERGLDLVAVDVPDLSALYPRGLVQSGPRVYVRWHSRSAANWYRSDKERYDYNYSDEELMEWIGPLRGAAGRTEEALLLFNNCHRGRAAANAQRLRELLVRLAPELSLVAPPAVPEPAPAQRSLFDDL
ncbi:MAG TPA: DUF72 domain-containing protein [Gemmataceae bacterium]|nr:DUF72 domain-containing protein [Gemmataceae bacterium]